MPSPRCGYKQDSENSVEELHTVLSECFSKNFSDFKDLKEMLMIDPLSVTIISTGSFAAYMKMKMESGADMAHLKPPHMQPPDKILDDLLSIMTK